MVATYDKYIRSANVVIQLPSVIALKDYVNHKNKEPAFTRRNIFLRDKFCCQYCGRAFSSQALTFDHVNPRCKGGGTSWVNVVSACQSCNNKKGNLPLNKIDRVGMRLLKQVPGGGRCVGWVGGGVGFACWGRWPLTHHTSRSSPHTTTCKLGREPSRRR